MQRNSFRLRRCLSKGDASTTWVGSDAQSDASDVRHDVSEDIQFGRKVSQTKQICTFYSCSIYKINKAFSIAIILPVKFAIETVNPTAEIRLETSFTTYILANLF